MYCTSSDPSGQSLTLSQRDRQTPALVSTLEVLGCRAVAVSRVRHGTLSTTQLLIRVVPTITASIARGSERCACLVSAFELLGSAGVVDVGRRQNGTVLPM